MEKCEMCKDLVSLCTCQRCEDCGTIYLESAALEQLNDENICTDCTAQDKKINAEGNCVEGCNQPERDCTCDKMATVEDVLNATQDIAPVGWIVTPEYPEQIGVHHPSLTDDQFISFGDVNGYFAFNDVFADGANGAMENLTDAKEIAADFWQQIAAIYPNLIKGE